jgi:hypothetical protein
MHDTVLRTACNIPPGATLQAMGCVGPLRIDSPGEPGAQRIDLYWCIAPQCTLHRRYAALITRQPTLTLPCAVHVGCPQSHGLRQHVQRLVAARQVALVRRRIHPVQDQRRHLAAPAGVASSDSRVGPDPRLARLPPSAARANQGERRRSEQSSLTEAPSAIALCSKYGVQLEWHQLVTLGWFEGSGLSTDRVSQPAPRSLYRECW